MKENIIKKIEYLIDLADQFINSAKPNSMDIGGSQISTTKYNSELFAELETSSQSLVLKLYGNEHPYYKGLKESLKYYENAKQIRGIFKAIKREIDDGFILSIRDLVSAEIFSDFIEMAEYLLKENYKDASAVIIGSVLENRLRLLTSANELEIYDQNGNPKKANMLNIDLYKADIYGKLEQKSVVAWLDLRNQAAHGHYDKYDKTQVEMMLSYVRDFISRVKL